ncbi:amidohydrolase family protein [Streptosporangium sp. NBC_01755]|uniref:amidohydrolase family protein n=1 Tax=unclassified Streptosporangium TaxID=2632669 RepID=UPI002DDA9FA5|nr:MULTISPECIES: amidohydrolase family protein [unclassified Streptosporangium]WSA29541.1 amidohydrolase family protein [Streptosporangium sp. NBC_01810]WSD04028.1 amidohydrolase family protein [Streptosporangium sp. NBC_01755]
MTFDEAARMFTSWAAAGGHEDQVRGALKHGLAGDAVILSHDVSTVADADLFDVRVARTIIAGIARHTGRTSA